MHSLYCHYIYFFFYQQEYEITPEEKRQARAEKIFEKYLQPEVSVVSHLCFTVHKI